MLIDMHKQFAEPASVWRLANPAVPVIGARIRRAIDQLTFSEIDRLGDYGASAQVAVQARLIPLAVDTQTVRWHACAAECNGQSGLKIEAVMDYTGDRGMLAVMPWDLPGAAIDILMTDTTLIVTACGVVENPEDLVAPVRDAIAWIEQVVATQADHVASANAAAMSLTTLLLRRRARRHAMEMSYAAGEALTLERREASH